MLNHCDLPSNTKTQWKLFAIKFIYSNSYPNYDLTLIHQMNKLQCKTPAKEKTSRSKLASYFFRHPTLDSPSLAPLKLSQTQQHPPHWDATQKPLNV